MHQGYLAFLLDLTAEGENRAVERSVRLAPDETLRPTSAFEWKIVVDVEGTVVVRGFEDGRVRVLGKARYAEGALQSHESLDETPNDFQWTLVELALRAELARAVDRLQSHPRWVDDVAVNGLEPAAVERIEIRDVAPVVRPPREPRAPRAAASAVKADGPAPTLARFLGGIAALIVLFVVLYVAFGRKEAPAPSPVATAAPPEPPQPPHDAAVIALVDAASLDVQIAAAPDLATAIELARPEMADDDPARGAALLTHYASSKLRWADVAGARETTIGHVLKDPDVERGKKLCVTGTVRQIERRDVASRKVYVGGLATAEGDGVAFTAVGSTGDIVKRSSGTLCGVVIGSAGGDVVLVGMFDLAENRAPLVEQVR